MSGSLPVVEWDRDVVQSKLTQQAQALFEHYQEHKSIASIQTSPSGSLDGLIVKYSKSGDESKSIIRFIETECVLTDEHFGKKTKIMPFWKDIISDIYDTLTEDGKRYYKEVVLEVPRGCAKTLTIAHLVCYHMIKNENMDMFVCSRSKEQAEILFGMVKAQLKKNPWLAKQIKNPSTKPSKTSLESARKELINKKKNNRLRIGSSLAEGKHGFAPSLVVIDESHALNDGGALLEAFTTGEHKRSDSLVIQISSAGHDRSSFFYGQHLKALKHLDGTEPQLNFYARIYSLPEHLDWKDPRNWALAIPSLGYTLSLATLARKFETLPARSFRTYYLGQWCSGDEEGWKVSTDVWDSLADPLLKMETFAGEPCECGYDHAYGNYDSPALVVKFRRGDKRYVFPFIWVTPKTFEHRIKNENAAFDVWRQQGTVLISGTDMVDEHDIVNFIVGLNEKFPIKKFTFDRQFKMRSLGKELDTVLGEAVIIAQDPRAHMLFPHVEKTERIIFNHLITHDGNGLMSWQIGNVKMKRVGSMANPLPDKNAAGCHIDCVMALFYAIACEDTEESGLGSMGEDFTEGDFTKAEGSMW